MSDHLNALELRLSLMTREWKGPTIDVLDTAETVVTACRTWDVPPAPALVIGLTELILLRRTLQSEVEANEGT